MNAQTNVLVPDVLLDHRERILADLRDKITVRPEVWLPVVLFKNSFPVFLSGEPGCLCLYYVDKAPRGGKRVRFEKDVDMVRLPVHFQDHKPFLPEDIADRAIYDLPDAAGQDRVAILRHQDHVVLQQETAVAVRVVGLSFLFLVHLFDFSFTANLEYSIIIL